MVDDNKDVGSTENVEKKESNFNSFKVTTSKGQGWTRFLEVEISAEDVDEKFKSIYEDYRTKAKIPGFRPGKAPLSVVKQKYADAVKGDVFEDLINDAYREAVVTENLWPLGDPKFSDIEFDENKPLKFKAEIEIRPEIELKKYKGFKLEKKIEKVTDENVEKSIEYVRDNLATFEPAQRSAQNGDLVIADLLKKYDKLNKFKEDKLENVEILLGAEGVLKEFQENLLGMSIGEMKDIQIKYPDGYFDNSLAGNELLFTAVVKEVKQKVLPEVNEEFVKKVSKSETVEEFRNSLKENLEMQAKSSATAKMRSDLIKKIVEENKFDIPISLLNRYLDSVVEDYKNKAKMSMKRK